MEISKKDSCCRLFITQEIIIINIIITERTITT